MSSAIHNPDFQRVRGMIEDLTCQTEVEGGDLRSVASSMLVMAAEFYREVHGGEGPDGLVATLGKLAAMDASRAEGVGKAALHAAMESLFFQKGVIEVAEEGPPSRRYKHIARAEK